MYGSDGCVIVLIIVGFSILTIVTLVINHSSIIFRDNLDKQSSKKQEQDMDNYGYFEAGDIVECINERGYEGALQEGKNYTVNYSKEQYVNVLNDQGKAVGGYDRCRFKLKSPLKSPPTSLATAERTPFVKSKKTFTLLKNAKNYFRRHEDIYMTLGILILIDYFLFNGGLRQKIQEVINRTLNSIEKSLIKKGA